jgi:hypothetical protein
LQPLASFYQTTSRADEESSFRTYWPGDNIVPSAAMGWDIVKMVFLSHSLALSEGINALLIRLTARAAKTGK